MKYVIKVYPKFKEEVDAETFQSISDSMINLIDKSIENSERSFYLTYPTSEQIRNNQLNYVVTIVVKTNRALPSSELFVLLSTINPLIMVNVKELRFCAPMSITTAYWTNEGETTYNDGTTYYDCDYVFHFNFSDDYCIQYVPHYLNRCSGLNRSRYEGVNYMWRCTACWDNFLKATTIDEAIKEFEEYYYDKLWSTVENTKENLTKAIINLKNFSEYRENRR